MFHGHTADDVYKLGVRLRAVAYHALGMLQPIVEPLDLPRYKLGWWAKQIVNFTIHTDSEVHS